MSRNPITKVRAKGDAFAIGHALGKASAEALVTRVFATEEYRALDTQWRGSDYLGQLEAAARTSYPAYLREIEGIVAGAGQDFETVFLWNCRGDLRLPADVSPAVAEAATSGCTTIQTPAKDGAPAIIAHNEDDVALRAPLPGRELAEIHTTEPIVRNLEFYRISVLFLIHMSTGQNFPKSIQLFLDLNHYPLLFPIP